jgi:hypothetical protein
MLNVIPVNRRVLQTDAKNKRFADTPLEAVKVVQGVTSLFSLPLSNYGNASKKRTTDFLLNIEFCLEKKLQ